MPSFYLNEINRLPEGSFSESPMLVTFPLYDIYQKWHGRNISATTPMGNGFYQNIFQFKGNLQFRTLIPVEKIIDHSSGVRYLIVHKRIKEEMATAFKILSDDSYLATQLKEMSYLFEDRLLDILFGKEDTLTATEKMSGWVPVYDDTFISVYDVYALTKRQAEM